MRTRYLDPEGNPRYHNRLLEEQSPYLIQHGHNPVDWYPWGEEAFERARAEQRPVFLSVGYATCHWCHVMERESFDNEEVADLINREFVAIKLDREQHPDIDDIYMTALQFMTGQGGWPISCFLFPDGKPFFAGTYFPTRDFVRLLERVVEVWRTNRAGLVDNAGKIAEQVARYTEVQGQAREIGAQTIQAAARSLLAGIDPVEGGFGRAPKFPQEPRLLFLLDSVRRGDVAFSSGLATTLDRMARGGIHDQIGGGFHRYSVDALWQVPHFEKMLYNQAQMIAVYSAAFALTGTGSWRTVVEHTVEFLTRELRDDETGLFFCGMDADSEGEEGVFYVWTADELDAALPRDLARIAHALLGFSEGPNFEGKTIPHLVQSLDAYAGAHALDPGTLQSQWARIRAALHAVRERRTRPLVDDKILVGWNAMTVTALVAAAEALSDDRCLEVARTAAESLWRLAWSDDAAMARALFRGRRSVQGTLEDYALFGSACLALEDATGQDLWRTRAKRVGDAMCARFWDHERGGFFIGEQSGGAPVFARAKSPMDGATASAGSSAFEFLVALAEREAQAGWRERALQTVAACSALIEAAPDGFPVLLTALNRLLHGSAATVRYSALGNLRLRVNASAPGSGARFSVAVALAPGWHVTTERTDGDAGIPATITAPAGDWELTGVTWPVATERHLPYEEKPREVWGGAVSIEGTLVARTANAEWLVLNLRLQACGAEMCLAPDDLVFRIPLRPF